VRPGVERSGSEELATFSVRQTASVFDPCSSPVIETVRGGLVVSIRQVMLRVPVLGETVSFGSLTTSRTNVESSPLPTFSFPCVDF
jgi:hypothetical protein